MISAATAAAAATEPTVTMAPLSQGDDDAHSVTDTVKAVSVRNASKSYGVGKRRSSVLSSLDMSVQKGTIYGLLGASGCGKTTLLSCIVGRRSFDSGEVYVFGGEPGTKESGIPGPRVGYMPQELALYGEFTIKETLEYFGRMYNLPNSFVKSQMEFLFKLLDLPPGHRFVRTLSGGQQRRVSFAVALFHDPELLILDEPTVGVDPLLRNSIWNHLVSLSSVHGRTVIITTHYIEEARQAHTIGMMRSGRLLAEESPQSLLNSHNLTSLEDVFLKLCMKDVTSSPPSTPSTVPTSVASTPIVTDKPQRRIQQEFDNGQNNPVFEQQTEEINGNEQLNAGSVTVITTSKKDGVFYKKNSTVVPSANGTDIFQQQIRVQQQVNGASSNNEIGEAAESESTVSAVGIPPVTVKRTRRTFNYIPPAPHRLAALMRKNLIQTFRNIGVFIFVFLLPVIQAILFCMAIGHDPTSLKLAVVNEELNPSQGRVCNYTTACTYSMYSCRYLRFINNETIIQVHFTNHSEAMEAAQRGDVWGVIHFAHNFTDEYVLRESEGNGVDLQTVIGSQIGVSLDWSNQQIALALERRLFDAFQAFNEEVLKSCGKEETAADIPTVFLDNISRWPNSRTTFTDFMAPGVILTILFFTAVSVTATIFIVERKAGLLDRSLVAGVQMLEIMLAHVANQFIVLLGQTALVFLFVLLVFKITCHGSLVLAVILSLVQGLVGLCFGLVVSSICDEEISAIYLALGSFLPNVLFSGYIWPIEGITPYLRFLAYCMPQTYAIESLRNIFTRGWGIERHEVYLGFITSLVWILATVTISLMIIRVRKYTG